jgi:hypothetical protein
MSTCSIPLPRREIPLVEAPELEGTCPRCPAVHLVDEHGAMPVHKIPPTIGRPVCAGSGQPALDIHPRKPFFVEGVRFL